MKTLKIKITENQAKFAKQFLLKEDDFNPTNGLRELIKSGQPDNLELAEEIAKAYNVDLYPIIEELWGEILDLQGYRYSIDSISKVLDTSRLNVFRKTVYISNLIQKLQRLKHIQFLNCKIMELSDEISNLNNLTIFEMFGCKTDRFPYEVCNSHTLEEFILMNIPNITEIPTEIGNLQTLNYLTLNRLGISDLPESVGKLKKLRKLSISGNRLQSVPNCIEYLTNLRVLNLNSNMLSELPNFIGKLTAIESLEISNNQLETIPKVIYELPNLQEVLMTQNNIPKEELKKFSQYCEKRGIYFEI